MDKLSMSSLVSNWGLGDLVGFKKVEKGVVNTNWIVKTNKGRFVLRKVAKFRSLKDLKFELLYLTWLKERRFPYGIPAPIKTTSGRRFLKRGGSFYWLYRYIEGRPIERFGHSELKECAKMMALYHGLIESSGLDNKKGKGCVFNRRPIAEEMQTFRGEILKKPKLNLIEKIFLDESAKLIPLLLSLNGTEYSKMPKYPLHRDINPENTLWENGRLVGVIDFENVSTINDTIIKDISGMLQYSCRDKKHKHKLDLKLSRFFLREYKKLHPLSDKEISFIPDIITAGSIEDFSYAYWMVLNDPKRSKPHRLKLYSDVAQWCSTNRGFIIKKLIG